MLEHVVGPPAAQENAAEGADIGDDGVEAGLDHGHLLGYDQIGREPGKEEIHGARIGELSQIDSQKLAVPEEIQNLFTCNAGCLACFFCQAAAIADICQFGFVYIGTILGILIKKIPEEAHDDAEDPCRVKDSLPAMIF